MAKDIGYYAYMGGFFGSLLVGALSALGIFEINSIVAMILVACGIFIGFYNISREEQVKFMVATSVLAGGSLALTFLPMIGEVANKIFAVMALVFVPAALIVAFNTIKESAKK